MMVGQKFKSYWQKDMMHHLKRRRYFASYYWEEYDYTAGGKEDAYVDTSWHTIWRDVQHRGIVSTLRDGGPRVTCYEDGGALPVCDLVRNEKVILYE